MSAYLVIDTAARAGAVGLWDGGLSRVVSWRSRNNHTAELMPAIEAVLDAEGVPPAELGGIAVTVGPGGFSAVRTGLGAAKGLALGAALPLVGVSTLEASAYSYRRAAERVCAVLSAGRGLVSWAVYGATGGAWRALSSETVSSVGEFVDAQTGVTLFCGEGLSEAEDALRARLGADARFVLEGAPLARLAGAAELGAALLASGSVGPAAAVEPRYLRPPGITTPNSPAPVRRGASR